MSIHQFVPPARPMSAPKQPVVLTDDMAKAIHNAEPLLMNDGPFPVFGKIIGWKRTNVGVLGAVVVNPTTGKRALYGIDFKTGKSRFLCYIEAPTPR